MLLREEREEVVAYGKKLVELGLTTGTFGNLSVYNAHENLMAISPTGMDYFRMTPEDVAVLTPDGVQREGAKPSGEYDMHRIFYQKRADVRAVIHTHSPYATTLACLQWAIEPVHYLIAYAGREVPCTPYLPIGTYALAEAAFSALGDDHFACLLGNHGLLAVGDSIARALDVAQQIEFLAQIYYHCRMAGGGVKLSAAEIDGAIEALQHYRKK